MPGGVVWAVAVWAAVVVLSPACVALLSPEPYVRRVTTFVRLSFEPAALQVTPGERRTVTVNATVLRAAGRAARPLRLYVYCRDSHIGAVVEPRRYVTLVGRLTCFNATALGHGIGRTRLKFLLAVNASDGAGATSNATHDVTLHPGDVTGPTLRPGDVGTNGPTTNFVVWQIPAEYDLEFVVLNPVNHLGGYLDALTMALISVNLVGVGGQIDPGEFLYHMKRPVVIALALACRFGLIPAVVLGLVELFGPPLATRLAVLAALCSPSEGAATALLILTRADLTAAAAVLAATNFAAFAMVPLWTIAFEYRIYHSAGHVTIPFIQMLVVFAYTVVSLLVGAVLSRTHRKTYTAVWRRLPGFTAATLAAVLVVDVASHRYVLQYVSLPLVALCAAAVAAAYAGGAATAFAGRLPLAVIVVVSVDVGCRTTYVTRRLLQRSLPQPEADIAKTAPVIVSALSIVPALVAVLAWRCVRQMRLRRYARTECSFLESTEDVSEPELVDAKETCI